ncbi:hypothetical protein CPB85DRAFT_1438844 [Mucidula mucida]|nr:hypothetical protein CPB85DRAFT_1438844 [Mucidula mucida]
MNRFDQYTPRTPFADNAPATYKSERRDDRGSQSGSDDGYYNDTKPSDDNEEDGSLTSQSLNADGTPKRPMNAFMIFARRRRPQVSAENQSMRTGEISKILSKEWTTMSTTDKQFYLDQAKQLKENFNSKYPDYVYRRRPNNSRKKRKTDPLGRPDAAELGDDMNPLGDFGEPSPSEASDGPPDHSLDLFPRLNPHFETGNHSRMATFPFSSSSPHPERLPPFMNDHRLSHSVSSPRLASQNGYPPYGNSGMYNDHTHGHAPYPGWIDRGAPSPKSYAPSPSSYSPGSAASPNGTSYPFPTLNTPFFPTSHANGYPSAYEPRGYTASPSLRDDGYPRPRALPPLSNLTSPTSTIPSIDAGFNWNRGERIDT